MRRCRIRRYPIAGKQCDKLSASGVHRHPRFATIIRVFRTSWRARGLPCPTGARRPAATHSTTCGTPVSVRRMPDPEPSACPLSSPRSSSGARATPGTSTAARPRHRRSGCRPRRPTCDRPQLRDRPHLPARPAHRQGRLRRGLPRHAVAGARLPGQGLRQDQRPPLRLAPRGVLRRAARARAARAARVRPLRRTRAAARCATASPWSTPSTATSARGWRRRARSRSASSAASSRRLLGALDALHRGHAMHRDLTPFNVFVCDRRTAEARRLRHRDAPAQPARRHGRLVQPLPRPERDRVGPRAPLAEARRRLSDRAPRGDAAARRHHERRCAARTCAASRAATTSRK